MKVPGRLGQDACQVARGFFQSTLGCQGARGAASAQTHAAGPAAGLRYQPGPVPAYDRQQVFGQGRQFAGQGFEGQVRCRPAHGQDVKAQRQAFHLHHAPAEDRHLLASACIGLEGIAARNRIARTDAEVAFQFYSIHACEQLARVCPACLQGGPCFMPTEAACHHTRQAEAAGAETLQFKRFAHSDSARSCAGVVDRPERHLARHAVRGTQIHVAALARKRLHEREDLMMGQGWCGHARRLCRCP